MNPFAVEEHREVATRLEEMTTQDGDLRGAISGDRRADRAASTRTSASVQRRLRAIGEQFDEFCRLLFAGGSASLQLGDEDDGEAPGGIEIVVRPPGKRLQRLAMLSGGERALTGVALLFAMLTVNPVPFCILDEVDAALDEANIGRFADALRRLAEIIDFVVITHNRATIEVADTIYGVTMNDAAVSRVLSLRLADIPAEVARDLPAQARGAAAGARDRRTRRADPVGPTMPRPAREPTGMGLRHALGPGCPAALDPRSRDARRAMRPGTKWRRR